MFHQNFSANQGLFAKSFFFYTQTTLMPSFLMNHDYLEILCVIICQQELI